MSANARARSPSERHNDKSLISFRSRSIHSAKYSAEGRLRIFPSPTYTRTAFVTACAYTVEPAGGSSSVSTTSENHPLLATCACSWKAKSVLFGPTAKSFQGLPSRYTRTRRIGVQDQTF